MRRKITTIVLPVTAFLLGLAVLALGGGSAGVSASENGATAPGSDAPLGWSGLLPVSSQPYYDNTSSIASSPLNAGVTIAWEERDEDGLGYGSVQEASNNGVGQPLREARINIEDYKQIGNVQVRSDSVGRRHIVYYRYNGTSQTCGWYAMVEADGSMALNETIPGSCDGFFKRTAIAAGPDNSVHVMLGRDNQSLYYFHRTTAGVWDVRNELLIDEGSTGAQDPTAPALAVTTQGTILAAWLQRPSNNSNAKYDVYTATRLAPNQWLRENATSACCTNCPGDSLTYSPALAADNEGGVRMAWADEECPHATPRKTNIYYREWKAGTGWAGQPLVLVAGQPGQQYWAGIAVDNTDKAHIVYATDEGHNRDDYRLGYVSGRGTVFGPEETPYYFDPYWQKEPAAAHGPGYIFSSFNTQWGAQQYKNVVYVYKDIPDEVVTPTPTAVPTPRCLGQRFTDVCPGDFFFEDVLALDQLGVISGYNTSPPCDAQSHIPCFKPFNSITRGQAAKVIVLGANIPANLQGAPHFADVAQTHTFYEYIEFAYNYGVLSGYPCGGPGEPCDPSNRPYFRPGNNITRGQLSKMISLGFDFTEPVSGQTFTDVPVGSAFYEFVQRMAARGIIGGYPCGGPAEPCDPQNRPYFRPGLNVTRGQAAKMVNGAIEQSLLTPSATPANTFTPTPPVSPSETPTPTATSVAAVLRSRA